MPPFDLTEAVQAERLGDAAVDKQAALAHYCEALCLLLPPGVVSTDRAAYDQLVEACERIRHKIDGLQEKANFTPPTEPPTAEAETSTVSASEAGPLPSPAPQLSVYKFSPGLTVRICQTFVDYDGQEILAGEVLHFLEGSYFPYEGGHTLRFAEKTIRLASIVDENWPIIENAGNAWFQPMP